MNNAFNIPQCALVLGANSDIARSTALALAGAGTTEFVLATRRPGDLEPLAHRLQAAGATNVETVEFDATDLDAHHNFVSATWERHRQIDLTLLAFGDLGQHRSAVHTAMTNYVGAVSMLEEIRGRVQRQGTGTIAVVSSVAAERPRADNYVYASTKAGLDSYTRGLADVLAPTVHVMVIRPGFVRSKMTAGLDPAPFAVDPDDVADDIVAGLRAKAAIVWSPPIVRGVMSALRHLPTPVHRKVTRRATATPPRTITDAFR
ncbi:MAG: SDR family NAD(P)-dependent oxidoreductase [Acidimicrobiales bacterium]|nr:SDR family NAD(P)-dependent oxidoreductase [Acidimicrobiales bacterium]